MTHLSNKEHYLKYKEYQKHYSKINAGKKRDYQNKYYRKKRDEVLRLLGDKCKKCGISDKRVLQVDHINGGGLKETNSMTVMYSKYIFESISKGSTKYQLLCANCNWIKRAENNENTKRRIYR